MAQQVKIAGALFNDVPSISVPDNNNVYHPFVDTSDANATAGDIASGKTAYVNGSKVIGNASTPTLITKSITANGTYNASSDSADGYSSVTVNVSGGGGLEYETGTWTPTENIARPTINFTKTHTSMPLFVSMEDNTDTYDATLDTNYVFCYEAWDVYHNKIWVSESSYHYGKVTWSYRASNATYITHGAGVSLIYPSTNSASSNNQFPRYWVTETGFKPYTNSTTRYWRAGRTYKWIAVWAPTT